MSEYYDAKRSADDSSPAHQIFLKAARTSLHSVEEKIRASVSFTYLDRKTAYLKEAWASGDEDASSSLWFDAGSVTGQTLDNTEEPDVPKSGKKGRARDPDDFPTALMRAAGTAKKEKKEKTVITYFAHTKGKGKSKNKRVVSRTHCDETLDSKVVTQENLPASTSRVPITSLFRSEDNPNLDFVPGQMDPDGKDLHGTSEEDIEELALI